MQSRPGDLLNFSLLIVFHVLAGLLGRFRTGSIPLFSLRDQWLEAIVKMHRLVSGASVTTRSRYFFTNHVFGNIRIPGDRLVKRYFLR